MKGLLFLSKMVYERVLISGGVSPFKTFLRNPRDMVIPQNTHWNKKLSTRPTKTTPVEKRLCQLVLVSITDRTRTEY